MKLPYQDPSLSPETRTADLLTRLSLDEKIAQVCGAWDTAKLFQDEAKHFDPSKATDLFPFSVGHIGRIFEGLTAKQMAEKYNEVQQYFVSHSRWGIPVMFHQECLHGVMEYDAISFPHPIAMAGSFNPYLVKQAYDFSAKDARARGAFQALTPVLDVARDPRWGRVEETFGEDPYLVSRMGLSAVNGLQGGMPDMLDTEKVIATLKHFAAHGQPEDGTNCAPANYSERIIREVFLYPFKVAIMEGKALSVMASYNEIDGVPSHASKWLLQTVLRDEFGFQGSVVSDYYAVEQLAERHHIAQSKKDTTKLALEAGVDIELPEPNYYVTIKELVESGEMDVSFLDRAVSNQLYLKFYSGLFDAPFVDPQTAERVAIDPQAKQLSYDLASECITLLKNENAVLPLIPQNYNRIAVVGPNADYHAIGGYSCPNTNFVTVLSGLKDRIADTTEIVYAKGCGITTDAGSWFIDEVYRTDENEDRALIQEAIEVAKTADIIILCIGGNVQTCREAWKESHLGDRPSLEMVGLQNELFDAMKALGKPIVVVLSHARPLAINAVVEHAHAIVDCWNLGQETGFAVADVLLGTVNPSGKLPISYPRSVGHLPVFYNHKPNARRGYLFDDISPLFPFGFGLSYTTFEITDVALSKSHIVADEPFSVNCTIKNIGAVAGKEVVQVYIRDEVSSVTRPVKELKAFQKVLLEAGETKTISIPVEADALKFYDINMNFTAEPGTFSIMVGTSSRYEDLITVQLVLQ